MCLSCARSYDKEPQVLSSGTAKELCEGRVVHCPEEFPCPAPGLYHVAFDEPLTFTRLPVGEGDIIFFDLPLPELTRDLLCGLRVLAKRRRPDVTLSRR